MILIGLLSACASIGKQEEAERIAGIIARAEKQYQSDNWTEREAAVRRVRRYHTDAAMHLLLKATGDIHSRVRIEALKGLQSYSDEKVYHAARSIVRKATDDNERYYALLVLASFKSAETAPLFAFNLKSNDWMVREAALIGLLNIDDPDIAYISLPYILQVFDEPNNSVKITMLYHLQIKNRKIYDQLKKHLFQEGIEKEYVFLKALLTAYQGYRLDETTRKKMIDFLMHPDQEVRILALRVLKKDKALKDREENEKEQ